MNISKKQRIQLMLNIALMLLILFTLVTCVVAWFSNRTSANVNSLNMEVERTDLQLDSEITLIEFPCATKITDTTAALFNTEAAVSKTYTIKEEGQLYVSVENHGPGMLAYVCDKTGTTDYYTELKAKLEEYFTAHPPKTSGVWTHEELQEALVAINSRAVGDFVNGNTDIQIVYWVEYDEAKNLLSADAYWDSADSYYAEITFLG